MTETFLQHYGWVLVSLLGGLLTTLTFVLGVNLHLGNFRLDAVRRQAILKATARKWIFALAALGGFAGVVHVAFPLFFSVAFCGARRLWEVLLATFFLQLVAYAICWKSEKPLRSTFFCIILMINGFLAPLLVGTFIGTFFVGAGFSVGGTAMAPTVRWVGSWQGLELLTQPHAVLLGLVEVCLSYIVGGLYVIRVVDDHPVRKQMRRSVFYMAIPFFVLSAIWFGILLLRPGFSVDADGVVSKEDYKYFMNFLHHGPEVIQLTLGGLLLLAGLFFGIKKKSHRKGFRFIVAGIFLVVMGTFFLAGFHKTPFFPSLTSLQSSLTIRNSSADFATLHSLFWVFVAIPVVILALGYLWYWMDHKKKVTVRRKANP